MHRLWRKKEKMAAHPIAEASITLSRSPSVSVSVRGQSAGQSSGQSGERDREWRGGGDGGEALPHLILLRLPQCFATAASWLTVLLRDTHIWTSALLRTLLRTLTVSPSHPSGTCGLSRGGAELHRPPCFDAGSISAGRASLQQLQESNTSSRGKNWNLGFLLTLAERGQAARGS